MSSGKRLTNDEALNRIREKCDEKNIEFIGFYNNDNIYINNKTYLILKCGKCGNIWNTTSYDKFVTAGRGCPNCIHNRTLSEDEVIKKTNKICKERDFTFLGFNGDFHGIDTKLILQCNKCNKKWDTTIYNNLRKTDRKAHTCGRKISPSMPSILNEERAIKMLKERLSGTSLLFISFDENGYAGRLKTKVLLRCKKCGKINTYSYRVCISCLPKCKSCETKKFSDSFVIKRIEEKCKILNYTFLGFDNETNTYNGKKTYLILKCNKCGYIWKSTTFASFCQNIIKCPGCINSWKMEKEVESYLIKHNIKYIHNCRNKTLSWLKHKISLSLDFYLPDHNVGIECQGRQHFEPVIDFGGEKSFQTTIERDKKKLILCKKHNVKLLYYDSEHKNTEFLGEKVYNDENNLIKEINSYGQKN